MALRTYGETPLLLQDLKIAPYTASTDTIGTAIDLPDQMMFELDWTTDNPELKSGGTITHAASIVVGGTFTIGAGGIPWNALATLAGWTLNSPSAGVETLKGTLGQKLPYFAVAGKLLDGDTSGDVHIGLVACILDKPPAWSVGESAEYIVSEMSGRLVVVNDRNIPIIEKHSTAAAINMATLFA